MSEPLTAEELDAYKDSMADSMVGSLGKPAVLRLFATIAALTERAERAFTEGVESVLRIRCMEHREVPAYNSKEITGAECAACKVVEAEARVAELEAALKEIAAEVEHVNTRRGSRNGRIRAEARAALEGKR